MRQLNRKVMLWKVELYIHHFVCLGRHGCKDSMVHSLRYDTSNFPFPFLGIDVPPLTNSK